MKLSVSQLRTIIKEEVSRMLREEKFQNPGTGGTVRGLKGSLDWRQDVLDEPEPEGGEKEFSDFELRDLIQDKASGLARMLAGEGVESKALSIPEFASLVGLKKDPNIYQQILGLLQGQGLSTSFLNIVYDRRNRKVIISDRD